MESCIFNIQRFSIHDGPGIRTTVFLKGCNLRCFWCHNPESWVMTPQIQYFPEKCILCGKCVEVCPTGSQQIVEGVRVFDRDLCNLCGKCVDVCYAKALVFTGEDKTVQEIIEEVKKDHLYYKNSGGGVTFSGGEPLLQKEFVLALLIECKKLGFHTAVDTAGNIPWEAIEAVKPYTDLFLYDIKAFDEEKHKQATGVGNQRIHQNLARLGESGARIIVRVPVIPGVADDEGEMEQIGSLLEKIKGIEAVELLPFHHLGSGKFRSLGLEYPTRDLKPPSAEKLERLVTILKMHGLNAKKMI